MKLYPMTGALIVATGTALKVFTHGGAEIYAIDGHGTAWFSSTPGTARLFNGLNVGDVDIDHEGAQLCG